MVFYVKINYSPLNFIPILTRKRNVMLKDMKAYAHLRNRVRKEQCGYTRSMAIRFFVCGIVSMKSDK